MYYIFLHNIYKISFNKSSPHFPLFIIFYDYFNTSQRIGARHRVSEPALAVHRSIQVLSLAIPSILGVYSVLLFYLTTLVIYISSTTTHLYNISLNKSDYFNTSQRIGARHRVSEPALAVRRSIQVLSLAIPSILGVYFVLNFISEHCIIDIRSVSTNRHLFFLFS